MNKFLCFFVLLLFIVQALVATGSVACLVLGAFCKTSFGPPDLIFAVTLLALAILGGISIALMAHMGFKLRRDRPLDWLCRQIAALQHSHTANGRASSLL